MCQNPSPISTPFLESLQANFTRCYNPYKEQAIDEAMITYKGGNISQTVYANETHQTWYKSVV